MTFNVKTPKLIREYESFGVNVVLNCGNFYRAYTKKNASQTTPLCNVSSNIKLHIVIRHK